MAESPADEPHPYPPPSSPGGRAPAPPAAEPPPYVPPASAPPTPEPQNPEPAMEPTPEEVQQRYDDEMQQKRDAAERKIREAPMIGARSRAGVPAANTPGARVQAGPTSMAYAVGGLKIFQAYGAFYEQVGEAAGGVLAIRLDAAEPATVYHLKTPDSYEEPPE